MNPIERRVRNMINPYSTAFARWWCHSGRHTSLARMIAAAGSRWSGHAAPGPDDDAAEAGRLHPPTTSMAARRAAVDAVLAERGDRGPGNAGRAGS